MLHSWRYTGGREDKWSTKEEVRIHCSLLWMTIWQVNGLWYESRIRWYFVSASLPPSSFPLLLSTATALWECVRVVRISWCCESGRLSVRHGFFTTPGFLPTTSCSMNLNYLFTIWKFMFTVFQHFKDESVNNEKHWVDYWYWRLK